MSEDMAQSSDLALSEVLATSYDRLLLVRFVRWATGFLRDASWVVRSLAFFVYVLAVYLGLWLLSAQNPANLIWVFGFPCFCFVALVSIDIYIKWAIQVTSEDIDPHVAPEKMTQIARRFLPNFAVSRQLLIALPVAALLYAISVYTIFDLLIEQRFTLTGVLVSFPMIMLFISELFTLLPFMFVSQWLTKDDVTLYALDPSSSVLIQALIAIARPVVWMMLGFFLILTSLVYAVLIPLSNGDPTLFLPTLATSSITTLVMVVVYFQHQYHLSRLTASQHTRTLSDIQGEINELYQRRAALTDEENTRLDHLRGLHAEVTKTNPAAFNLRGTLRFLSPIAIPLLILLLNSLNLPFGETITNLLEALR